MYKNPCEALLLLFWAINHLLHWPFSLRVLIPFTLFFPLPKTPSFRPKNCLTSCNERLLAINRSCFFLGKQFSLLLLSVLPPLWIQNFRWAGIFPSFGLVDPTVSVQKSLVFVSFLGFLFVCFPEGNVVLSLTAFKTSFLSLGFGSLTVMCLRVFQTKTRVGIVGIRRRAGGGGRRSVSFPSS